MPRPTAPFLVLVADDDSSVVELVARHLRSSANPAFDVIEATDGKQALRMAREQMPDLIVLDVMMPGMSGWEVCRKIREDAALAHTSVVMLTGIGEELNGMTSPLFGADAYLDKPFDFGELDAIVRGALKARAISREMVSRPVRKGFLSVARAAAASLLGVNGGGCASNNNKGAKSVNKKGSGTMVAKKKAVKKAAKKAPAKKAKKAPKRKAAAKKAPAKRKAAKKRKTAAKKA